MSVTTKATGIHTFDVDVPDEALEDLHRPELFSAELRAAFRSLR